MTEKNHSTITQIHDRTFRNAMSDLRVARDFLGHYLPPAIQEKIDFSTLKMEKESYVDKDLTLLVTDVLYSAEIKDKKHRRRVYIYVLLEHLSKPQKMVPWRMIKYEVKIMEDILKKSEKDVLPLIIPIVVYNGSKKYPYSTSIYDLFQEGDKAIAKEYMFNRFQLVDLSQIPDETIQTHPWSRLMELLLKHAEMRDAMAFLESLSGIFRALAEHEENADNYILGMLKYALQTMETLDEERFNQFLHRSLPKELERKAMTLAQQLEQKGLQKGIQLGHQEGMKEVARKLLKTGADIAYISEITSLTASEINVLGESPH